MSRASSSRDVFDGMFNNKDFICCKPPQDQNDDGDGCLDLWEDKLEAAKENFKIKNAHYLKLNGIHTEAVAWEEKLKKWFEDLCDANEKAEEICDLLNVMIVKVKNTTYNAEDARDAIEAVLCLVRSIFDCTVDLLKTSPDDAEGHIQILRKAVECEDSLDERQKQEIITCIQLFSDKIQLAYEMQEDVLKELLEMMHCANLIITYLGARRGLRWQIRDLRRRILGEERRNRVVRHLCYEQDVEEMDTKDDWDDKVEHEEPNEPCTIELPPCGDQIFKPDQTLFPIDKSEYYEAVKTSYEKAHDDACCLKGKKEKAKEESDEALEKQNQYQNAVDASNDAVSES